MARSKASPSQPAPVRKQVIKAACGVRKELNLGGADVKHIKVEVNAFFPTVVQHPEPHDEIEAQFSLPHAMAASFLDERVLPASFSVANRRLNVAHLGLNPPTVPRTRPCCVSRSSPPSWSCPSRAS